MDRTLEIELKYQLLEPTAGEHYLSADSIAGLDASAPRTVEHEDRYFDTSEGALALAGYAGRIRRQGKAWTLNLKASSAGDGALHRRAELEAPATGALDPRLWPRSAAQALVIELCGDAPLVDLVTIRQVRRRRNLVGADTKVELSVDDVAIVAGDRVLERFAELEAELVDGAADRMSNLRAVLEMDTRLAPARGSKFERALAAVKAAREGPGTEPDARADAEPAKAPKSPGVLADDSLAEAGRKVLRFHLERMIAREKGTREGIDPEELHSMRVATRRMRAAWRVFGEGFRPGRSKSYVKRLREVAAMLGSVRDLDVLIEATDAYRAELPELEREGLEPLIAVWRSQRDEARNRLMAGLDSAWYRKWVAEYREFTQAEGAGAAQVNPTVPHLVRDTFPSRIWLAYEHVRAFESVLRWADVTTLHEMRIAAKRLRYTLEFGREVLVPEAAGLIARIVTLQDHLGLMNDAHVGATLARTFLVEQGARLNEKQTHAISRYLETREQEVVRLRRTVGRPWRSVAGLGFRRALGRVVAPL